ncbi:hypothetical protein GOV14_02560 [Candidatus Pacearchaeota archaeon]|nr:hypothetical protein [Candidatus Pacearchaeota archaeon]
MGKLFAAMFFVFVFLFGIGFSLMWQRSQNVDDFFEASDSGMLGSGKPGINNDNGLRGNVGRLGSTGLGVTGGELVDEFDHFSGMHWGHMPLSYNLINCTSVQVERLTEAMNYITNATHSVINFFESESENLDLEFLCSREQKDRGFVAGEAELNYYLETNLYAPSTVYIYYAQHCVGRRPTIEIHEILHALGLDHSENDDWDNILNPYTTRCDAEISGEDIKYLLEIYA